jgi:opacity protein-like surface antigen
MLKIMVTGVSVAFMSAFATAEPVDFIRATTLSWTSDGSILHDTPDISGEPKANPQLSAPGQNRITLDDTGKSGWYIAPNFGINLLGDFNNDNLAITYDTGYSLGLSIGKEINPGFRMQLDIAQIKNDLKSVFVQLAGGVVVPVVDAKITQTPIILNAIWEPRGHDRLFPYIGLGVGAIKGDYSVESLSGAFESLLDIGWAFAIQVKAGIKIELSHSSDFNIGYQFLHAHYSADLDLNNNLVTMGFEFRF